MKLPPFKPTPIQRAAYRLGGVLGVLALVLMLLPGFASWHQSGPDNPGHEDFKCGDCHSPASGYFGYGPVTNDHCLSCHENPDDRHPLAQSAKAEFVKARQAANIQRCVDCHDQHRGRRITAAITVCKNCHQETAVEDDPVDIPHTRLIEQSNWVSCLGCHDFHGNHDFKPPTTVAQQLSEQEILRYFETGESPYGYRRLTVMQTMREKH